MKKALGLLAFIFIQLQHDRLIAQDFSLNDKNISIVYSNEAPALDSITAHLLAEDIQRVTGNQPVVITNIAAAQGNVIVIGNVKSTLVQKFIRQQSSFYESLLNKWECFGLKIIEHPVGNISKAFIIAGSDTRGTAYGVFTISEKIGVSPWYWWADVASKQQNNLSLHQPEYISSTPSVKYRGIFINDEDWGLQPWAAKTFEPETGDIGPKTYAKVFELLLRLKANLIWPAMHPSTKAFFHYPQNIKAAEDYNIVVGSSHAEPMLRNNVDEWHTDTMGDFNYITNKENVYSYWEDRVKEAENINAIYSMGMRGVHDSQMEGVKDARDAVPLLEKIIQDQRGLLEKYNKKDVTAIPQVFTAYKEVLDIYDNGLKIPEDITLVWPDDNYGYIQRLSTREEKQRTGGAGVYYHASYWGRPHDYLWLSSTHPALIREEMMKAYETGADRLWVLNVGDIKPIEYDMQLFLDMAYNALPFKESRYSKLHLNDWVSDIFGPANSKSITDVTWDYYQLAFERRPEFMGWSQVEPITKTTYTTYNHFSYSDEAQQRINRYEELENKVKALRKQFGAREKDAFYQLVYYPVVSASLMNKKFLYSDKAYIYSKQNRISTYYYAGQAAAAYNSIVQETEFFNKQLSGGKWKEMMSMQPRDLPVYQLPVLPLISIQKNDAWNAVPEGYDTIAYKKDGEKKLPAFVAGLQQSYFIDIYLSDSVKLEWAAKPSANWIHLSAQKGMLQPNMQQSSARFWVRADWLKVPAAQTELNGFIDVVADGKIIKIYVTAFKPAVDDFKQYNGFAEASKIISIHALHYQDKVDKSGSKWQLVQNLGFNDSSLMVVISDSTASADTAFIRQHAAQVSYTFYSFSEDIPILSVYTLPTHPLNKNFGMRYAISVDDAPMQVIDFRTIGRSEEWKQNVLRNAAIRNIQLQRLKPGKHTLKIYAIDPGVVLDRMLIKFGNVPQNYGVIAETWKKQTDK